MESLVVYRLGEPILSVPLKKNLIRLGRSASAADVVLQDPSISREHCMLVKKDGNWFLEDCSRNGVLDTEGAKLNKRSPLCLNTLMRLSKLYSLAIEEDARPISEESKTLVNAENATRVVRSDAHGSKIIFGLGKVHYTLNGEALTQGIPSNGLTIGTHISNSIALKNDDLSRFHARVDFVDNQYILSDLASTNGTYLNDLRVMRVALPDRCTITAGPLVIEFALETTEVEIEPKKADRFLDMVSRNRKMKKMFSAFEVVSPTEAPVFIHGETGTGKELAARAIHKLSNRDRGPFVALNCAALPKDLVESELFGHERGAFTGAVSTHRGALEQAHGGTLFLDEIGELSLEIQAKLLRALEQQEIRRLGSAEPIKLSLRLISASHKDLMEEVSFGTFRPDLFYRLHVVQIELPPLRDRVEDLDLLVPEFLRQLKRDDVTVSKDFYALLENHSFPGNIRELRNIVQRSVIELDIENQSRTTCVKQLTEGHLGFLKEQQASGTVLNREQLAEKKDIIKVLEKYGFHQSKAAKAMGIACSSLHDKMRRYGLLKGLP